MESENNSLIGISNSSQINGQRSLYTRRWIILFIVSLINICNAGIWISFASVSDLAANFYETTSDVIDLFSTVFFVSTIIVGFIAMWILDHNGLKLGIYSGALLTAIGISIRALSSVSFVVNLLSLSIKSQFVIAIIGQIIAGCAQPFVLFTPTKVAEFWFPSSQRAFATTITGMANPAGIVLGNLISPMIVTNHQRIPFLSIIWSIPSIASLILTIIFVRSSKPPTPPSGSAEVISSIPYFTGIKELLRQKAYLMLLLYMGCAVGTFSALVTMLEQILKTKGYGDRFSATCTAIMIGSGIVGSAILSYIVDLTKHYMTAIKIAVGLTAISINALFVSFRYHSMKTMIAIFCGVFGFFGFMTYPIGLELGIECSFPVVPEATSSGLLMLCGQLQGILYIYLMTQLAKQNGLKNDYTYSLIVQSSVVVLISCLFILLFFTEYKRLKFEKQSSRQNESNSLAISDNSHSNSLYS